MEGVQTAEWTLRYRGQIQGEQAHGFGVGEWETAGKRGFFVGDWAYGRPSGIGKWQALDFSCALEGEYRDGCAEGLIDILWDDGSQWSGTYQNDRPWGGKGKALVNGKARQGIWQNGICVK